MVSSYCLAWQVLTVVCSSSPAGSVSSVQVWLLPRVVAEWQTKDSCPLLLGTVPLSSGPGLTSQILALSCITQNNFAHKIWQSLFLQPNLIQTRGKAKKYLLYVYNIRFVTFDLDLKSFKRDPSALHPSGKGDEGVWLRDLLLPARLGKG